MKLTKINIILTVLGILVIAIVSVAAYFYVSLSGNPLVMWQQKKAVLRIYEERYEEEFRVTRSHYDYKRYEYSYTLEPAENPGFIFTTSVSEARQRDLYAKLRAEDFIRKNIEEALKDNLDPDVSSINIHEEFDAVNTTESDVLKRLGQNNYVISISMDTDLLTPDALEAAAIEMGRYIDSALNIPLGSLKLRLSVYDGASYQFSFIDIR